MFSDEDIRKSTVREFNAEGHLVRAGFWWWEPRRKTHLLLTSIHIGVSVFAVFGIVGAIFAFSASFSMLGLILTVLSAGAIAGAVWIKRKGVLYTLSRRAAVFCDDGSCLMEHPDQKVQSIHRFKSNLVPARKGFFDLTTIEMKPSGKAFFGGAVYDIFCVYAYFSDGQQALLGYDITDERVARIVVVQLNQALREMRDSIASRTVQRPQEVN